MKVKDFIELLSQCDPEAIVLQGGGDLCGYFEVQQIEQRLFYPDVYKDGVNGPYEEFHMVDRQLQNSDVFHLKASEIKRLKKLFEKPPVRGVVI
jgi:hypothetical protein